MSKVNVEREVVRILRQIALSGSDREISLDDPLGELGLGLDSLALVEFAVALEKRFEIDLPDNIWSERGQLTLQHFVDSIMESVVLVPPITQDYNPALRKASVPVITRFEKVSTAIRERGLLRGIVWVAFRFISLVVLFFYERKRFFILAFNLLEHRLPSYSPSLNLILRKASAEDTAALDGLWAGSHEKKKLSIFQKRLESGYTCLTARYYDKIIGIDWLSEIGDDDPITGLKFRMHPGSCYGLDLHEHKMYQGKGVGLALLAFSLAEAKKRGYHTQIAFVDVRNVKMLSTALHLFNFKKIGYIHTTRIFGKPFSTRFGPFTGKRPMSFLSFGDSSKCSAISSLPRPDKERKRFTFEVSGTRGKSLLRNSA